MFHKEKRLRNGQRVNIRKALNLCGLGFLNGGGGGIRTHGTLARSTVFKTAPINRSGTPPKLVVSCSSILYYKYSLSSSSLTHIYATQKKFLPFFVII